MASSQSSHYSLNKKQEYILQVTHKFRFITAPLLATHRDTTTSSTNIALTRLHKQGYLGRHYNSSYKLQGKPAEYYLEKKGIRWLREHTGLSDKALHSCYKDKHMNEGFRSLSLRIYKTFLKLREQYPDNIFYTANDLREHDKDLFPKTLPQLYFHTNLDPEDSSYKEYVVDIFTENLFFYIKRRIDQYITHYEEDYPGQQYPTILFSVPSSYLKDKGERYFEEARDKVFASESELPAVFMT